MTTPVLQVLGDAMNHREEWIAAPRKLGHHPHPAPTKENPEEWDCDGCNGIWRILTPSQVRQKFAHLARRR